jgi:signal peptidase I
MRFMARGESMRPFILNRDIVEVGPVVPEKLNRGDVVLCQLDDGRPIVHRVVQKAADNYLILGDALPYPDGHIPHAQVIGRVDTVIRHNKQIKMNTPWMKTLVGLWLMLIPLRGLLRRGIGRLRRDLRPGKSAKSSDNA